jgi:hypothetical protein
MTDQSGKGNHNILWSALAKIQDIFWVREEGTAKREEGRGKSEEIEERSDSLFPLPCSLLAFLARSSLLDSLA